MRLQHNTRLAEPVLLLLCLALPLLNACQPGAPDSPFKRYLNQLGLALSVAPPIVQTTDLPPIPKAGELQLTIPQSRIDRLDFLQLSGCALQKNIGRRQTSLGRFAKPSQRLLLELEYLRLAPDCIQRLRSGGDNSLADNLEAAWLETQAQLPARIFNATLGSDEYRALWLTSPVPGDYPRSSVDAIKPALHAISSRAQRWLDGDYRAHNRDFELALSEIARGVAGTRLQGWSRQIDWLAAADLMVAQGLTTSALCRERKSDPTALRRIAVAQSYAIDVIQPLLRDSKLRYMDVIAPITSLEALLGDTLPPLYSRWRTDRNRHVAALATAPQQHLEHLRSIRKGCALDTASTLPKPAVLPHAKFATLHTLGASGFHR